MTADETQDIAPPTDDFFDDEKAAEDEAHPEVPNPTESEEETEPAYGGPWLDEEEKRIWGPKVYDVPEPEEEGE